MRIPFSDVPRVIWHWLDADLLEHQHRSVALYDTEKNIIRLRPLERDLKIELVAVERKRRRNRVHNDHSFSTASLNRKVYFASPKNVPQNVPKKLRINKATKSKPSCWFLLSA